MLVMLILLGRLVGVATWIALARWTMSPRNVTFDQQTQQDQLDEQDCGTGERWRHRA
jgi:hypothetical protein